jgi:hypothetical protein
MRAQRVSSKLRCLGVDTRRKQQNRKSDAPSCAGEQRKTFGQRVEHLAEA